MYWTGRTANTGSLQVFWDRSTVSFFSPAKTRLGHRKYWIMNELWLPYIYWCARHCKKKPIMAFRNQCASRSTKVKATLLSWLCILWVLLLCPANLPSFPLFFLLNKILFSFSPCFVLQIQILGPVFLPLTAMLQSPRLPLQQLTVVIVATATLCRLQMELCRGTSRRTSEKKSLSRRRRA